MKSINVLYQEVKSDEELRSKFLAAYGKGEVEGFLKENECDATAEEVQKFIEQELRSGSYELSEEELALVVGGKGEKDVSNGPPKYKEGDYVVYYLPNSVWQGKGTIVEVMTKNGSQHEYKIHGINYKKGYVDIVPENRISGYTTAY